MRRSGHVIIILLYDCQKIVVGVRGTDSGVVCVEQSWGAPLMHHLHAQRTLVAAGLLAGGDEGGFPQGF